MSQIDRKKTFGLGIFMATPAIFLSAACDSGKKVDPNPTMPPPVVRTVEGISANPATIATPNSQAEKARIPAGEVEVRDGIYVYTLYREMSIDELLNPDFLQKVEAEIGQSPAEDIRLELQRAKNLQSINPKDKKIIGRITTAAQELMVYCKGEESKEFSKRMASALNYYFPDDYHDNSEVFLENCYWGTYSKDNPQTLATREPTSTPPHENPTPKITSDGFLAFSERGYRYDLYQQITLDQLLQTGDSDLVKQHIDAQALDDILSLLRSAKAKEQVDPQDPAIIKDVNSAANVLNVHCDKNIVSQVYSEGLASYIYLNNPQDWQNNKRIYLDGACFWGEKATVSQEHETIDLEYGLFIYKGVTYDELLAGKNLDKLQPLYVQPNSFTNLKGGITTARNLDSTNPNDPKLIDGLLGAAYLVANKCDQSADAREYMRLLLSLVYENHPNIWEKIYHYASECSLVNYD